ncbi:PspC domain-containing protein [Dysgonomonas sp. Marseille-P4361]|uniref:PspC domain-containing protein n=1 Tax=Dysgonomonas sp. Marseille-P4361 TaxID=2161820 RepID=UPI000D54F0DF|nr:PspC domain-containing protein [Dysgonomonas sp. Marseille-P4361]
MKPTVKVSIGGFAFSLEEDAYSLLNGYLESLKNHFRGSAESEEIIADIEFRMSELLQMRMENAESVVSLEDAEEIMKIMGNPKDFGDAGSGETSHPKEATAYQEEDSFRKRRLFRDLNDKVIGGVCSGLGHYFRIDVTLVRLLFVGLFFILFFSLLDTPSCMVVVFIYGVLWLVMPAAKTFNQKLAMGGKDLSIENIEDRSQPVNRAYRGSGAANFFKVLINVILGVVIFSVAVAAVALVVVFVWLCLDENVLGLTNYLILTGYNTVYAKVALALSLFLPVLGLLCLLIKLFRRSDFTTGTLIYFLMGALLWAGSFVYLGSKGFSTVYQRQYGETVEEIVDIKSSSDTLYVRLGDEYQDAEPLPNMSMIFYKGEDIAKRKVFIAPEINVYEDSTLVDYRMEIEKLSGGKGEYAARLNAEKMKLNYSQTDSLLLIMPDLYDNDNPWRYESYEVNIYTPAGKAVVLDYPSEYY